MESKFNHATRQRPEGYRQLNGDLVTVDIPKYILQLKEEAAYRDHGKNAITVFKSEKTTITLVVLKKGENIHSGPEEGHLLINLYLLSGGLQFVGESEKVYLSEGQLLNYHENASFKAEASLDSVAILNIIK